MAPSGGFDSSGVQSGPFTPTSLDYSITNLSAQVVQWEAQSSVAWCTVSPSSGQLDPGQQASVTAELASAAANALPAGSHSGQLTFRDQSTGSPDQLRTVRLDIDTAPGGPGLSSSITQFGITWEFDQLYEVGQFANGDWWVLGPTTLIGISPSSSEVGGRTMNGSMVNPSPTLGTRQGYDSAMYDDFDFGPDEYDPILNVALDVSPSNPLVLAPHSSLVSTVSNPVAGALPQLETAAVLTVLPAAPAPGSFRPPYCGSDKTIGHTISDLDYSVLGTLAPVASTPAMSTVNRFFERPWIDHVPGWPNRYIHPSLNMRDYGRDLSDEVGNGALMLHLDFTEAEKETLLVRYVQLGIDLYGIVADGGTDNWYPLGGHGSGRKWPILFAGLVLGDSLMSGIGSDAVSFGEDGQTFYVEETSPGVYNYGHGGYTAMHEGMPEFGFAHASDPSGDDVTWDGNPYRVCCTANVWHGFVLAARIMGVRGLWNHDALFDYQDRYVQTMDATGAPDWQICWSDFPIDMWRAYRPSF